MKNEHDAHQALCDALDRATNRATWTQPSPRRHRQRGYSRGWWLVMGGLTLTAIAVIIWTR